MNSLGEGATGIIYEHDEDRVMKYSKTSCGEYERQYATHISVFRCFDENVSYRVRRYVHIPRPINFVYSGDECWYIMERIFNPAGYRSLVHLYMNEPTVYHNVTGRGIYLGIDEVNRILDRDTITIEDISYYMGYVLGIIHYGCLFDGVDIEWILGEDIHGNLGIYIVDFDQLRSYDPVEEPMKEIVDNLVWSIVSGSYYPIDQDHLKDIFWDIYLQTAHSYGYEYIAQRVYEEI